MSTTTTELLSPAGDFETVRAACRFGADAVYLGGPALQMRAQKAAFTMDGIREAAAYLHAHGKKLYVTVNSFAKNEEFPALPVYAKALWEAGADAAIISDLGVLSVFREAAPGLPIHISTQANCQNYRAAQAYAALGASRIVLARELTLPEIAEIRANTPPELELEAFVHGAMCMAYSGRCFLSAYLTGRSANRGECVQSCRWRYHLVEETRPGSYLPVEEEADGAAILSSHDLNCLSFLDAIREAGVMSLKIEGRMKTPYYVATVTNAYRRAIDHSAPESVLQEELLAVSHRPYASGFYFGDLKHPEPNDGVYRQSCRFAAVVKSYENGRVTVEQRNRFVQGDRMEVVSPDSMGLSFLAENLTDSWGNPVTAAPHAQERITMDCPFALSEGDFLRVRTL